MDEFIDIILSIDRTIYSWIPSVYELIVKLAGYEVFSPEQINGLSRRVYALIGIFMLFKLSFSMISYIVNPDDFSDKTKGFGGLIKNVIISMVLIVAVPYIFAEAFYVQRMILEDGTLIKMVLPIAGEGDEENSDRSSIAYANRGAGDQISFVLFTQFAKPNDVIPSIKDGCQKLYKVDEKGNRVHVENSEYAYQLDDKCAEALHDAFGKTGRKAEETYNYYKDAMEYENFSILVNHSEIFKAKYDFDIYTNASDGKMGKAEVSVIKYNWFLCFLIGIVVLLFLITLCIDVAARTIKLAFYQIIAPVPIISNCDPKGKKDGMLQKWTKACISTYLDLFIRLIMFFLAIFIIRAFAQKFASSGNDSAIIVFIIIGALVFAKQAPKIIEDLTGLKIENFTLNPIKKVQTDALFGKNIVGAMGGAAAGTVGMLTGAGLLRSVGGAISGAVKGKGFFDSYNSTLDMNKKIREARLNNSTFIGRATAGIATRIGIPTGSELIGARIHEIDEAIKEKQNAVKNIELKSADEKAKQKEIQRTNDMVKSSFGDLKTTGIEKLKDGVGAVGAEYVRMLHQLETLNNLVGTEQKIAISKLVQDAETGRYELKVERDAEGKVKYDTRTITTQDIMDIREQIDAMSQNGWQALVTEILEKRTSDAKMQTKIDVAMADYGTAYSREIDAGTMDGVDSIISGEQMNKILGASVGASSRAAAEQRRIDESHYDEIKALKDEIELLEEEKRNLYEDERRSKANEGARTFQ